MRRGSNKPHAQGRKQEIFVVGNWPSFCFRRFLVEATAVLEKHLDMEGIFRKSGSVARQKELKVICVFLRLGSHPNLSKVRT